MPAMNREKYEKVGELTAHEIEWLDAINHEKSSIDYVLQAAMTHASNRREELIRKEKEFWTHIRDRLNLSEDEDYQAGVFEGRVSVTRRKQKE